MLAGGYFLIAGDCFLNAGDYFIFAGDKNLLAGGYFINAGDKNIKVVGYFINSGDLYNYNTKKCKTAVSFYLTAVYWFIP